jgi:hypothetical protein
MTEKTIFTVYKNGYDGNIATFSNTCVDRVELFAVSAVTQGGEEVWSRATWPDWLTSGITNAEVTITISPLESGNDRSCFLSALTYDEDYVLIQSDEETSCNYIVNIIQKKSESNYTVPTNTDMPKNILPKCVCSISGVNGGEEQEDGYHLSSDGGYATFSSQITKQNRT